MMRTVVLKSMLAFALGTLGHSSTPLASAADVQIYKVSKGVEYQQLPERTPTNLAANAFVFEATVLMNEPGSVSSARVRPKGSRPVRTLLPSGDRELRFVNRPSRKSVLEDRFPNGNFTFAIDTQNDGQRSPRLALTNNIYPPVPFLHHLVELQAVNAHGHLVVSWKPFVNGTTNDFIRLRIEDTAGNLVWESRRPGEAGALDGTATRALIERGELSPSTTYNATLFFEKVVTRDINSYPGAVGISSYYRRTRFTIATTSDGPADVERYELSKGRLFDQEDATSEPDPKREDFIFVAEVHARETGSVVSVSLTTPTPLERVIPLVATNADPRTFEFSQTTSNRTTFDALFPPGNYVFNLETATQGDRRVGLWFDANNEPRAPHLLFDPSQEVAFDAPLTLSWDLWTNATRDDFIQLRIEDDLGGILFKTPDFGEPGALDGHATSVTIPTGTLLRAEDHHGFLTFRRFNRLNWFDYPGALGVSSVFSTTEFEIQATRPDLEEYSIARGRGFQQETNGPPVPDPNDEFIFDARVEASSSNAISSATLITPRGASIPLILNPPDEFEFSDTATNETAFNALYPAGSYTFDIQGRQGPLSVVLNVPDILYPPAPEADLNALGNPEPDVPVTIRWKPWDGGTTNDFIRVRIQDDDGETVYESPDRGDAGALTGVDTSFTIPAGIFLIAEDYEGRIRFERFVVENEIPFPGAEGTASYFSRTDFDIETVRPDVEDYRIERGRRFEQTTTAPPLPDEGDEHEFNAQVQGSAEGLISLVTLTTPLGNTVDLEANDDGDEFEFTDDRRTLDEYNSVYPPGVYTFTVTSVNEGEREFDLPVPPNDFPPAPHLLFNPSAPVFANRPLVLTWDPWAGATADDFIQLRIEDANNEVIFETPDRGDPGALNGLTNSVTIDASTLPPGQTYEGQLVFERIAFENEVLGSEGRVTYFGRTDFQIIVRVADVEDYRIERGVRFEQTTAAPPLPDPNDEFEFNAEVQGSAPARILLASLRTPTPPGTDIVLVPNNDGDEFEFSDQVSTQAEFDALYPTGTYEFTVQSLNQGVQTIPLDVPASTFPPAPHVVFDPGTTVPADQPLVLNWDPWVGGTNSDFIQLRVEEADGDVVFETFDRGDPGALSGVATSTTIPANTLVPGETYEARLVFEQIVHTTNDTTGAEGRVTYFARTDFDIKTVPGDLEDYRIERGHRYEQPTVDRPVADPDDEFEFNAEVQGTEPNFISSAILTTPLGANLVLEPNNDFDEFEFSDEVSTEAEFNNLYPGGTYTFTIQGVNQGTQTNSLLVPPSNFPPAPYILNGLGTDVPPDRELVVTWEPWGDGGPDDFIQLRIETNNVLVFETPDRGENGALTGSSTFAIVPLGTFASIQRYEGRLVFERIVLRDETTVPGAEGRVTDFSRTDFEIETSGGDIEDYRIERGVRFEQTTSGPPLPDPNDEFEFNAEVQGSATNLILSANLRTPPSSVIVLEPNNDFDEFEFSDQVSTLAEFDSLYPAGSYRFIVQSVNQGTQTIDLDVPASEFPPAPHVVFNPETAVPAHQSVLIFWDPWVGGTEYDFIQLRVEDADNNVVFETPDRGDAGALNGRETGIEIPSGRLVPDQTYEARLVFQHIVLTNETAVPGADGTVIYFARTDFDIKTLPLDVREYDVFKEHVYVQTSNEPPTATEFVFRAVVEAENDTSVVSAALFTPLGQTVFLTQEPGGNEFELQESRASQDDLEAEYPDGDYTLIITGFNDSLRFIPATIIGAMYPSAPQLSNYDAAQSINAAAAFVLEWNPYLDGTFQDHIDVQIEDLAGNEVFDTPGHGNDGALDGLATSVTIPAFTLQPGQAYEARILFQKILRADDAGYPGVVGRVGYSARTFSGIATAAAANPPPRIQKYQVLTDGSLQFSVFTLSGATYQIQGSPNMIDWITLGTLSATSGLSTFTVPPPPSAGSYFYRAALIR